MGAKTASWSPVRGGMSVGSRSNSSSSSSEFSLSSRSASSASSGLSYPSASMDLTKFHDSAHAHDFQQPLSRIVMVRKMEQRTYVAASKQGQGPKIETLTKETVQTFRGNKTERKVTTSEKRDVSAEIGDAAKELISLSRSTCSSPELTVDPKVRKLIIILLVLNACSICTSLTQTQRPNGAAADRSPPHLPPSHTDRAGYPWTKGRDSVHPLIIQPEPHTQHSVPDATGMTKGSRYEREVEEAASDGGETQLLEARAPQKNRNQRGRDERSARRVGRSGSSRNVSYYSPGRRNISPTKKPSLTRSQREAILRRQESEILRRQESEILRKRQEQERVKALLRQHEAEERAKAQEEVAQEVEERKQRVKKAKYEQRKAQQRAFAASIERQPSYHNYHNHYH